MKAKYVSASIEKDKMLFGTFSNTDYEHCFAGSA